MLQSLKKYYVSFNRDVYFVTIKTTETISTVIQLTTKNWHKGMKSQEHFDCRSNASEADVNTTITKAYRSVSIGHWKYKTGYLLAYLVGASRSEAKVSSSPYSVFNDWHTSDASVNYGTTFDMVLLCVGILIGYCFPWNVSYPFNFKS